MDFFKYVLRYFTHYTLLQVKKTELLGEEADIWFELKSSCLVKTKRNVLNLANIKTTQRIVFPNVFIQKKEV